MPVGSEAGAVQKPLVRYAREAGWTYLTPGEAPGTRRGITSPVLDSVLVAQIQRLNPGAVDHLRAEQKRDELVRLRPNIEGNLDAWEYLKRLKTVFVESENRERNIRLLDPANVEANTFHVTDEFTFSNGSPPDIRLDAAFFINGIPILVSETKAATHGDGIGDPCGCCGGPSSERARSAAMDPAVTSRPGGRVPRRGRRLGEENRSFARAGAAPADEAELGKLLHLGPRHLRHGAAAPARRFPP